MNDTHGPTPSSVPPWFVAPDGIVLTGAALASSGVQTPWPIPEHAVLLEVTRVE